MKKLTKAETPSNLKPEDLEKLDRLAKILKITEQVTNLPRQVFTMHPEEKNISFVQLLTIINIFTK